MASGSGRLLGRPTPAEPLGEQEHRPTTAPTSKGVGLRIPFREEDATDKWERGTEDEDMPDDPPLTARERQAY